MTTYLWGTGLEMGAIPVPASDQNEVSASASNVKTGSYSAYFASTATYKWITVNLDSAQSDIAVGTWLYKPDWSVTPERNFRIRFNGDNDAQMVEVRTDENGYLNAYVNGSLVDSGSIAMQAATYYNIQVRVTIDNSVGTIETLIDGAPDIDYTGDTQPGTDTEVSSVDFYVYQWNAAYIDDMTICTGGFPGDIRYDGLVPNGDDSVAWDRSAGASNYECVDEIPPSDTDYVYTDVSGEDDWYDLGDWSGTGKNPQFVMLWARAKKDEAAGHQVYIMADDGSQGSGTPFDLLTSYAQYSRILTEKPSGGAWTEADIDSLLIGIRSVIV